jgi:hypothetical protein
MMAAAMQPNSLVFFILLLFLWLFSSLSNFLPGEVCHFSGKPSTTRLNACEEPQKILRFARYDKAVLLTAFGTLP